MRFNEYAGWAPKFLVISHIFFYYFIRQETIFPHLIKLLLKTFGKLHPKAFPVVTRSKTFLTSATAVDTQQMWKIQKQPSRSVLRKRCSEIMQQIYRRTLMLKCDFSKTVLQLYLNCTLSRVFSCNIAAYFQNIFSQEYL